MNISQLAEELPVEYVRWFYYHHNTRGYPWKRFGGCDSLKIEEAYRARKLHLSKRSDSNGSSINTKVVVRGSLFLVDVDTLMCEPIFWTGNKRSIHPSRSDWCSCPVKRGIWFNKINWIPLDQELSLAIEAEHVKYVIPQLLSNNKEKKKRKIHRFNYGDMKVNWMGSSDIFLVTKAANPFPKIELRGDLSSIPIARGYNQAAVMSDAKPAITHLCFVVHGIGQQLASIRHECSKIRQTYNRVIKKHYSKLHESGRRLEFIPVDWRSELPLNSNTLNNITVGQMRPLRSYINNCFVDILYYTSSYYRTEILRNLKWELMRQYNLFLQYNPHFLQTGGHVSVIAHSLGSVLMYDLLKENSPPLNSSASVKSIVGESLNDSCSSFYDIRRQIEDTRSELYDLESKLIRQVSACSRRPYANTKPRNNESFRVPNSWKELPQLANLFMIGSPLALFIAVNSGPGNRNWFTDNWFAATDTPTPNSNDGRHSGSSGTSSWSKQRNSSLSCFDENNRTDSVLNLNQTDPSALIPYKACRRIFNIFHSYDPIAYRIEPLLLKHYSGKSPLVLPTVETYFQKKNRVDRRTLSSINLNRESSIPGPECSTRVRFRLPSDSVNGDSTSDTNSECARKDRTIRVNRTRANSPLNSDRIYRSFQKETTASRDGGGREAARHGLDRCRRVSSEVIDWYGAEASDSGASSRTASSDSAEETFAQRFYKRLSVVANTTAYRQHQSRAFKLFSRYVVRRSSHVTNLEPQTSPLDPYADSQAKLDYRVDYEWQKSFSPLAVLGAHNSYWTSKDLVFFIAYQLFGQPEAH